MLIAIVGYPDLNYFEQDYTNIRGCGKTATMTYYLYRDYLKGKKIYANYGTSFSKKMRSVEIVDMIFEDKTLNNVSIGFDEFQENLTSMGEGKNKIKFYSKLVNQSRKKAVDIYYCAPLFKDINNRIREKTNIGLHPCKYHYDGTKCFKDSCEKPHYIEVRCFKPYTGVIKHIKPEIIGKLYDTYEIIDEDYEIETEKEQIEA